MATKTIGPKGQILIPKPIREAIGLKPGVEVVVELRDEEIVISKPKIEGNYTQYYISNSAPKCRRFLFSCCLTAINLKQLILEEVSSRHALP